ncbi:MAG: peptide deformylase [Candidatus Omnitrophica bacterium]|nr:peptide deformylase [Candidatus Omnitrophota bacterium]MCF7893880.1 peptide deformylase [Candidatus Omnitrophota bacterium]
MMKTKLKIHKWPDKILKKKSKEIENPDQVIADILDQMYVLMKATDGIGLAANQVGLALPLIVVEVQGKIYKLINPKIIKREGFVAFREGCLSFPGIELEIKRNNKICVEALDQKGKPVCFEPEGISAVVFQHEIDHINGVTFIDRVSLWKRLKITPQLNRIKNGKVK